MATSYAVEWTDPAIESRKALAADRQVLALDLVQDLACQTDDGDDEAAGFEFRVYRDPITKLAITYARNMQSGVLRIAHVAEPQVPIPPRVFISYSHKDRKWLFEIRKSLDILEQQQLIRIWSDAAIRPGMEWLKDAVCRGCAEFRRKIADS